MNYTVSAVVMFFFVRIYQEHFKGRNCKMIFDVLEASVFVMKGHLDFIMELSFTVQ